MKNEFVKKYFKDIAKEFKGVYDNRGNILNIIKTIFQLRWKVNIKKQKQIQKMKSEDIKKLEEKSNLFRREILKMALEAKGGHIAPAYSIVELLTALYFNILKVDPKNHLDEDRDRLILSKGHGCLALYAVLAHKGFFSIETLKTFCKPGSCLGGHPELQKAPGIEATTGSLGHGLSMGVGIALAGKIDNKKYRVFTIIGDGECNEGSIWEAFAAAVQFKLDNLIVIIDSNKLQATGFVKEIINPDPSSERLKAFDFAVKEIEGHNFEQILKVLKNVPFEKNKPSVIIAHTIKGKGVSYMENDLAWHYKIPNEKETKKAFEELGEKK